MSSLAKCLAGVAFAAVGAVTASADITITPGNIPQTDQEVLFNRDFLINDATTVQGITNPAGGNPQFLVDFTNLTGGTLHSNGGQARIEGLVPSTFTQMSIALDTPGATFQTLIFNLDVVNKAGDGGLIIKVHEAGDGTVTTPTPLFLDENGQNFFTIVASNGQSISSVDFLSTRPLADIAQVRIGGVGGAVPVPLPAAALPAGALLGLGGLVRTIRGRKA